MQLLLEIGQIYECPFSKDDEDDVWLIFKAALGIKGTERVGAYGRFIMTEMAEKQFRKFLRDQGRRRAAQEALRRIAGRQIAKYLSEKILLRLVAVANAVFGFWFNRSVTRKVGKWAKVKAKIRASTFQSIDELQKVDRGAAVLALPVIFLAGIHNGDVNENVVTLYAQASSRLELSSEEVEEIEQMSDAENLEVKVHERLNGLESSRAKSALMNIGVTAAAASSLKFDGEKHACLLRLGDALGVHYSREQLEQKIDHLRK
jgi:hypothetical protein